MSKHSIKTPVVFENRSGNSDGNTSEWGLSGLWDADNNLLLGTQEGWDQTYLEPTKKVADLIVLCVNLCAGRTPEQIAEAFALYDNREKVVEKLNYLRDCARDGGRYADVHTITSALALLEKKEGGDA